MKFSLVFSLLIAVAGFSCPASPTDTNFSSVGPNIFPAVNDWTGGAVVASKDGVILKTTSTAPIAYHKTFQAEAGGEYFFAVDILSSDRVVVDLGGLMMSYHRQGMQQTICGLVRPNRKGQFYLNISLKSLGADQAAAAELKNFRLQKVERPTVVVSLPRDGKTLLLQDGAPLATIVYPAGTQQGKSQAEAIQSAIKAESGVSLPVISDIAATEEQAPVLKKELRDQNLVIIGRLSTNRALWPAYTRFLAAEDGYYPGGDGFAVRTAADVLGNGKNHIVLGGSDEVGVQKAVDRFIKILTPADTSRSQTIELPWLLEVQLGGKCLAEFQANQELWRDADNPMLPAMTGGYGKVVRWYENAMGFYWSDLDDYRKRAQDYLKIILEDHSYTHQYIVEFFVRAVEMLDAGPFFTESELSQVDSLILNNFLDFLTLADLTWMTTFSPPYDQIQFTNRHQIAPWYADLIMARYLERHVKLGGELKELVDFRLSEKDTAFRAFVSSRNGPSMPGIAGDVNYGEFPALFYRYALENDLYKEFFDSGLARQTLALERIDHTTARFSFPVCELDMPDELGVLAHLTHDGRYQWLSELVKNQKAEPVPFQGRYVADVHHYDIGDDLSAVEPGADWAGIKIVAQPEIADQTEKTTLARFPLVSIRGGFKPSDDYVAIAGINPRLPAGVLVRMDINGQSVFDMVDSQNGGESSRITTNGASALNLDGYNIELEKEAPQASEINWKAQLSGAWALQTETPISADMTWRRDVIRLAGNRYVFADTFTARHDSRYLLRVAWHGTTPPIPEQGHWKISTVNGTTSIVPLGDGFSSRATGTSLFSESTRTMKAGESATMWTLVQGTSTTSPPWTASLKAPDQLELQQGANHHAMLHCGPLETRLGKLTSDFQILSDDDISVFGWTKDATAAAQSFTMSAKSPVDQASMNAVPVKAAWGPAISTALTAPTAMPVASVQSGNGTARAQFTDISSAWSRDWSYDGLLKPARVWPISSPDGIVDFGKTVSLNEVRSFTTVIHFWKSTSIPADLKYAVAKDQNPPQKESPEWLPLTGDLKDRPGTITGNYGEIHPLPVVDQSLFPHDVHLRYLKSADADELKYYVNDTQEARHPVRVRVLRDMPGETEPLIVANTNIFPSFPRKFRDDDFSLSILQPDGKTVGSLNLSGPVQSFLVADQNGSGHPQVLVLKADGKLDAFSVEGNPLSSVDLFQQLVKFDQTYGSPNTREPAGGQRMPFSLGLWRKDSAGASKIVVGRYGNFSFLDQKGNFEGVLIGGPYTNVAVLPRGYDFSGTGTEETLVLEMSNMLQIGGDSAPVVRDPQAFYHWPEVYKVESQKAAKGSNTELLAGEPVYEFRVLEKFGGNPRYAIVARSNYIGIYDAREKQWVFSWAPPGPIRAAALVSETQDKITMRVATVDGILWNLSWDAANISHPSINIQPVGLGVSDITASPALDGTTLLSTSDGLYLTQDGSTFSRVAQGGFRSADFVTLTSGQRQIVAADMAGKISSYKETKSP